jgi:hypothetical protein
MEADAREQCAPPNTHISQYNTSLVLNINICIYNFTTDVSVSQAKDD